MLTRENNYKNYLFIFYFLIYFHKLHYSTFNDTKHIYTNLILNVLYMLYTSDDIYDQLPRRNMKNVNLNHWEKEMTFHMICV